MTWRPVGLQVTVSAERRAGRRPDRPPHDRETPREVAVGLRADGAGPAAVITIGRVVSRRYLARSALDGWLFGGRRHGAHPRSSPGGPSVLARSRRCAPWSC